MCKKPIYITLYEEDRPRIEHLKSYIISEHITKFPEDQGTFAYTRISDDATIAYALSYAERYISTHPI